MLGASLRFQGDGAFHYLFTMPNKSSILAKATALLAVALLPACAPLYQGSASRGLSVAPDSFRVAMATSRGPVTIIFHRDWSPWGVDRMYQLIRAGYYNDTRFFRVVPKFVVQWGLAADPAVTALQKTQSIPDDSVRHSNLRGTISFARSGRGTRTTQLFINLVDNARLDLDSGFGFPPIGQVISGMAAIDSITSEYNGKMPGSVQDSITRQGNSYLMRAYPKLDYIIGMKVEKEWRD